MKRFNRNAIAFFSGFALIALVATCTEVAADEPTQAIIECTVEEMGTHKVVFNNDGTGHVEFKRTGVLPMVWSNGAEGKSAQWVRVNGAGSWISLMNVKTRAMGVVGPDGEVFRGHCKVLKFTNA